MTFHNFYFVGAVALLIWSGLLWLAGLGGARVQSGRGLQIGLGLAGLGLAVLPIGEFTLWRWMMSVHANPSVLLVGFLAAYVGSRLTGRPWLTPGDRLTAYVLCVLTGALLYGSAMGFVRHDFYAWDWETSLVVVGAGIVAALLLAAGSRIGILLVIAIGSHVVDLIESNNVWDYVLDPVFWIISMVGVTHHGVRRLFAQRSRDPGAAPAMDEASQ